MFKANFFIWFSFFCSIIHVDCVRVCPNKLDYYIFQFINPKCYDNPDGEALPGQVIQRLGLNYEKIVLQTEDNYFIEIERAYKTITKTNPVIIGHGLSINSLAFLVRGAKSYTKILVDEGYDVYVINWRGSRFSRGHTKFSTNNDNYWLFSFHQMGIYDLKAVTSHVYQKTKQKAFYIGFSMGTTAAFIYSMKEPEHSASHLLHIIAMAPIALFRHSTSILVPVAPLWPLIRPLIFKLWHGEALPYTPLLTLPCLPFPIQMKLCLASQVPVLGVTFSQIDWLTLPVTLRQNSDSLAQGVIGHYQQFILSGLFQEYDHGEKENLKVYGSTTPPLYNVSAAKVPFTFLVGQTDPVGGPTDSWNFYNLLPKDARCGYEIIPNFAHLDFLMARDIVPLVISKLVVAFRNFEKGDCYPTIPPTSVDYRGNS